MGQFHSSDASWFMNEAYDSSQHVDVPVGPDAEILRADASFGQNRGCLSQDQARTTDGATSKMNEMPVVRVFIVARILTHRRDGHAIILAANKSSPNAGRVRSCSAVARYF